VTFGNGHQSPSTSQVRADCIHAQNILYSLFEFSFQNLIFNSKTGGECASITVLTGSDIANILRLSTAANFFHLLSKLTTGEPMVSPRYWPFKSLSTTSSSTVSPLFSAAILASLSRLVSRSGSQVTHHLTTVNIARRPTRPVATEKGEGYSIV
jgi:hypothetical protein